MTPSLLREIVPGHRLRYKSFESQQVYLNDPRTSGRWRVPQLSSPMSLDEMINRWVDSTLSQLAFVSQISIVAYQQPIATEQAPMLMQLSGSNLPPDSSYLAVETRTVSVLYTPSVEQPIHVKQPVPINLEPDATAAVNATRSTAAGDPGTFREKLDAETPQLQRAVRGPDGTAKPGDAIAAADPVVVAGRERQRVRLPDL